MKKLFLAAGIMIITGAVISITAYFSGAGKSNTPIEYKEEPIHAANICLNSKYTDILIIRGDELSIKYPYSDTASPIITNDDNTFTAEFDNRTHSEIDLSIFSLNFNLNNENHITLEIPESFNGSITINSSAGDLNASDVNCILNINIDMGDAYISNCSDTYAKLNTGDISASNISGNINFSTELGDIKVSKCSGSIELLTDKGNIDLMNGDIQNSKCSTNSGNISINYLTANKITINSDQGDITGTELSSGSIDCYSSKGDINLNGLKCDLIDAHTSSGDISLKINSPKEEYNINGYGNGQKTINMSSEMGDTEVKFMNETEG